MITFTISKINLQAELYRSLREPFEGFNDWSIPGEGYLLMVQRLPRKLQVNIVPDDGVRLPVRVRDIPSRLYVRYGRKLIARPSFHWDEDNARFFAFTDFIKSDENPVRIQIVL